MTHCVNADLAIAEEKDRHCCVAVLLTGRDALKAQGPAFCSRATVSRL